MEAGGTAGSGQGRAPGGTVLVSPGGVDLAEAPGRGERAALLERLEPVLPEVVISREIGSGVVPMDPRERAWRELHGQVLRFLAERAKGVTRIFCGLPEVLK